MGLYCKQGQLGFDLCLWSLNSGKVKGLALVILQVQLRLCGFCAGPLVARSAAGLPSVCGLRTELCQPEVHVSLLKHA